MKSRGPIRSLMAALACSLLAGCAARPAFPSPSPAPPAPAFPLARLRNLAYRTELSGGRPVRLREGEYREAAPEGAGTGTHVILTDLAAFGDLDRDGSPDAAVVLAVSPGGSGTFHYLAAVFNRRGEPEFEDSTPLGDRVRVRGVWIEGGLITVRMTAHAPGDPLCCPSQEITRIYRLRGNTLTRAD